jgi:hypothetical protein
MSKKRLKVQNEQSEVEEERQYNGQKNRRIIRSRRRRDNTMVRRTGD